MADELPELILADAAAWRTWLAEHCGSLSGVWLVLAKKGTVAPTSLSYEQALEEALCQWLDRWPGAAPGPDHLPTTLHAPTGR